MHIVDARCVSGSEMALTVIDALLGVAARIDVDDCWLTTNNNLQITKNSKFWYQTSRIWEWIYSLK